MLSTDEEAKKQRNKKWITFAVLMAILVLILGTYPLYADSLFNWSVDTWIPRLQYNGSGAQDRSGWAFFSSVSIFSLQNGPIVIVLANSKDRAAAFYFVIAYIFQVYLVGYLQLIYHKPAPFWTSATIQTFDCMTGYAAPASGMEVSLAILLTIWAANALKPDSSCKLVVKIATLIAGLLFCTLLSLGHVYNGDTSLDQMIFGALLAVWSVVFTHTMLMNPIIEHVKELHLGKTQAPNLALARNFVILITVSGCLLFIGVTIYVLIVETVTDERSWQGNIVAKCPDLFESPESANMDRFYTQFIFASFGQIGYLVGAYCGIVFQYKRFEGLSKISPPKEKACVKGLLRTLCLLLVAIPYQVLLREVPRAQNVFVWLFVQDLVSGIILFFVLFGLSDQILLKVGLYDRRHESTEINGSPPKQVSRQKLLKPPTSRGIDDSFTD